MAGRGPPAGFLEAAGLQNRLGPSLRPGSFVPQNVQKHHEFKGFLANFMIFSVPPARPADRLRPEEIKSCLHNDGTEIIFLI